MITKILFILSYNRAMYECFLKKSKLPDQSQQNLAWGLRAQTGVQRSSGATDMYLAKSLQNKSYKEPPN